MTAEGRRARSGSFIRLLPPVGPVPCIREVAKGSIGECAQRTCPRDRFPIREVNRIGENKSGGHGCGKLRQECIVRDFGGKRRWVDKGAA